MLQVARKCQTFAGIAKSASIKRTSCQNEKKTKQGREESQFEVSPL